MRRIAALVCATIVALVVALLGMIPFTLLLIQIVQPNNFQGPPVHGLILSLPLGVFCGYMVFCGVVKQTRGVPMIRMKVVLTVVSGILVGPFAGFYGAYWLCSICFQHDCMWRFGALFFSLLCGAPVGMVIFGLIGFGVGCLLDKRAKRRASGEAGSPFGPDV